MNGTNQTKHLGKVSYGIILLGWRYTDVCYIAAISQLLNLMAENFYATYLVSLTRTLLLLVIGSDQPTS